MLWRFVNLTNFKPQKLIFEILTSKVCSTQPSSEMCNTRSSVRGLFQSFFCSRFTWRCSPFKIPKVVYNSCASTDTFVTFNNSNTLEIKSTEIVHFCQCPGSQKWLDLNNNKIQLPQCFQEISRKCWYCWQSWHWKISNLIWI